jgi:hypothetical protein
MANWIRFELKGDYDLILKLRSSPGRIMEVLRVKLDALTNKTAGDIVAAKLSGQILHRRTGVLSGSVHATPATIEGTTIRGGIEAAGGPAAYGKIHEFGTPSAWTIINTKARALSFMLDGKRTYAKRVTHPAMLARPFMKPTALEIQETLNASLARGIGDIKNEK